MTEGPRIRIAIVGAGAWGTALAIVATHAARAVDLIAHRAATARHLAQTRVHLALPGVTLDPAIAVGADAAVVEGADLIVLAPPAQALRETLAGVAPRLRGQPVVVCSKGIELRSLRLMHEIVAEMAPASPCAVLSGPTFAGEVARGLPAAVSVAASDPTLANRVAAAFATPVFRPYASDDPVGVEVAGAVKNVIAIACGLVEGRGLGNNARAALMTRGLAEITRLALALGGRAETMLGLAGVGDLALTCGSRASRNFSFGIAIGEGRTTADACAASRGVIEGVASAAAVGELAAARGVEMPIVAAVAAILHRGAGIDATIGGLLARPLTREGMR